MTLIKSIQYLLICYRKWLYKNRLIASITLIYFILSSIWLLGLYHSFLTTGDLGHYVQMFRNTVNGDGILTADLRVRSGNPDGFYLWEHFALILFAFVPIYYIFPYVETLLILKTFLVSLSIILLWLLARKHLDEKLSLVIIISYIFNPFLFRALSFNFQEQIILPAIIFAQFYFYYIGRNKLFILFTILALFVSEYASLLVASSLVGLAIVEYRNERNKNNRKVDGKVEDNNIDKKENGNNRIDKKGIWLDKINIIFKKPFVLLLFLSLLSILYYFIVISIMNSNAEAGVVVDNPDKRVVITDHIASLISNQSVLTKTISLDIKDKILYINLGLMPVFYTALLSPVSILPLIIYVGSGWLVDNASIYEFDVHHPFYILPFIYIGYIFTIRKFLMNEYQKSLLLKLSLLVSIFLFMFQTANFIEKEYYPNFDDNHTKTLHEILDMVPNGATVLAQGNIQPNIANRYKSFNAVPDRYYSFLNTRGFIDYHYIIFDRNKRKYNYWNYDRFRLTLNDIINTEEYRVWIYSDDIFVLSRDYNGSVTKIGNSSKYRAVYTGKDLVLSKGRKDGNILIHQQGTNGKTFWFGPYKFLPPGRYKLIAEIKRDGLYNGGDGGGDEDEDEHLLTLDVMRNRAKKDPISSRDIKFSEVGKEWTKISFTFQNNFVVDDVEFRGMSPSSKDTIYLKRIIIEEE